jgi:hypothetical protein
MPRPTSGAFNFLLKTNSFLALTVRHQTLLQESVSITLSPTGGITMNSLVRRFRVFAFVSLLITHAVILRAADLSPAEIILKHLDSIGTEQVRNSTTSRAIQAFATYRILVGGSGAIDGKAQMASEGRKADFLFKINAGTYRGEQFIYDGNHIEVVGTYADKSRSEFGNFVQAQDILLRENLLGGVWSTSWALLDVEGRKAKLHSEGTKKVDGKELLAIRYLPHKNTDLDIILYFDPQTFHHVMTVYRMEPSTSNVGGETAQAGKSTRRYRLEERFSDFKTVDGLTLPTHYDLRYTLEAESGFTKSIEWELQNVQISNNIGIDARSFEVK